MNYKLVCQICGRSEDVTEEMWQRFENDRSPNKWPKCEGKTMRLIRQKDGYDFSMNRYYPKLLKHGKPLD